MRNSSVCSSASRVCKAEGARKTIGERRAVAGLEEALNDSHIRREVVIVEEEAACWSVQEEEDVGSECKAKSLRIDVSNRCE